VSNPHSLLTDLALTALSCDALHLPHGESNCGWTNLTSILSISSLAGLRDWTDRRVRKMTPTHARWVGLRDPGPESTRRNQSADRQPQQIWVP
jgi:hypothetical protein